MNKYSIFFIFLLPLLLCVGCNKSKCNSEPDKLGYDYLVLNNKALEREIMEYSKFVEQEHKNNEYVIHVYCKNINDSITRYVLNYNLDPGSLFPDRLSFICSVDGKDVFFTVMAAAPPFCRRNFFAVKDEAMAKIIRKNFPKYYNEMINKKGQEQVFTINDGKLWFLTFLYDKLIGKTVRPGHHIDKSQAIIDGKEVWI